MLAGQTKKLNTKLTNRWQFYINQLAKIISGITQPGGNGKYKQKNSLFFVRQQLYIIWTVVRLYAFTRLALGPYGVTASIRRRSRAVSLLWTVAVQHNG